jgi:hypothetical protein
MAVFNVFWCINFFKKCLIVWHKSFYLISGNDQDPGKWQENFILLR